MADILEFKPKKRKEENKKERFSDPIYKRFGVTVYEYLGLEHKDNRPKEIVKSLIEKQLRKETMIIRSQIIEEKEEEKEKDTTLKANIFERVDSQTRYKLMNFFVPDNVVQIKSRE